MNEKIHYTITYFGRVELPVYTGQVYQNVFLKYTGVHGYDEVNKGYFFTIDIHADLCFTNMDGKNPFVVLKSKSIFHFEENANISEDDAYKMIKMSIEKLKAFRGVFESDIHNQLLLVRIPTKNKFRVW